MCFPKLLVVSVLENLPSFPRSKEHDCMNFGKCFSTAFARNPAQAEGFAQAVSTPPQDNATFLKSAVSPYLDVTPRLAGPGTYSAPEWLNALTERLRRAAASRALVYAAFTVLYLVPTLWLASGKLIWDDE